MLYLLDHRSKCQWSRSLLVVHHRSRNYCFLIKRPALLLPLPRRSCQ